MGAYDDIVKAAEAKGIPIATTNSYDGTIRNRNNISHTGQDASAAAIAGEAVVECLEKRDITKGSIILPNDTAMGNVEVNNRVTAAYRAMPGTRRTACSCICGCAANGAPACAQPYPPDPFSDVLPKGTAPATAGVGPRQSPHPLSQTEPPACS